MKTPLKSLFVKLFIWFWLAHAVLIAVVLISGWWLQDSGMPKHFRAALGEFLALQGRAAADAFEKGGAGELLRFQSPEAGTRKFKMFLLEDGRDVAGRKLEKDATDIALASKAASGYQIIERGAKIVAARPVKSSSGRTYICVAVIDEPSVSDLYPSPLVPVLRLALVFGTAGLVCYAFAVHVAIPIGRLSKASRRISEGDLAARVGHEVTRRKDEIGDLGRDFDAMITRIESLVASQKRMIHELSHELRSPLARLQVALGLARDSAAVHDQPALDRIESEVERLNDLIGNMLNLARLDSGIHDANRIDFDIVQLTREVCDDADFEACARNCQVKLGRSDPCFVTGHPELLRSAIENVVRNAVRFTANGTAVEVQIDVMKVGIDEEAVITVRDHGPGVSEQAMTAIFRPFFRGRSSTGNEPDGFGLGLAIAERCIAIHSGRIIAFNSPNGGLTVEMRLPIKQK